MSTNAFIYFQNSHKPNHYNFFFLFKLIFNKKNNYNNSPNSTSSNTNNKPKIINLSPLQITTKTFKIILNYLYTSKIIINKNNIQNILQTTNLLLLIELKQTYYKYLLKYITTQNYLNIINFTSKFNYS